MIFFKKCIPFLYHQYHHYCQEQQRAPAEKKILELVNTCLTIILLFFPLLFLALSVRNDLSLQLRTTKLVVQGVGQHLAVLAIARVLLPVEEPVRDLLKKGGQRNIIVN